jgi:tryptophanyl-tRNA synthetase
MMNRAHAYKAAADKNLNLRQGPDIGVSMGLYGYPVLMAADILLFDANFVPVGTDQAQHIEMARDIAERFNGLFGAVLTVPEVLHSDDLEPIRGIDGRKMSKSYENAIPLFATSDELRKLLRSYKTDSTAADAPKNPGANGLFQIYTAFVDRDSAAFVYAALVSGNMTWGKLKELTIEAIDAELTLLRQRFVGIRDDIAELDRVLCHGATKARTIARNTMRRVHDAVGVGGHR